MTNSAQLPSYRSKIANGHVGFQARSAKGRRLKEVMLDLIERCPLEVDAIVGARIRGAALIVLRIEEMTAAVADGAAVDDEALASMLNCQNRIMREIGIIE